MIASIIKDYSWISPFTIVKGYKIIDTLQGGVGCKYKAFQQLYGLPTKDTFTIWGDPGSSCRTTPMYNLGDTTIILINQMVKADTFSYPTSKAGDYYMSYCGNFTLLVKNDSVFGGNIMSFTFNGFPLNTFMDSLYKTLDSLNKALPIKETVVQNNTIAIYPNPTTNKALLNFSLKNINNITVKIFDFTGKQIKEIFLENKKQGNNTEILDVSDLKTGDYLFQISCLEFSKSLKISIK